MKQLARITGLAVVAALFLVGCGDDGGGSSAPSNADQVVATYEDLTLCTAKREGATAYVKDEKAEYVCTNGDWVLSFGGSSESGSHGGNSAIEQSSSSEDENDSTAFDTLPIVAVTNKTITGVSQKGPFVNGSSVTVQELDGKTLAQTGKSFRGRITNDKGEFSVSSVSLASQYALLEATGYYYNEVTGQSSNAPITLNALVDLSKRDQVNINILTHLEYERVLYLVGTGMNVPAAKKQAEKEIFKAFGFTGNFSGAEDLDITAKSEGDAALLAISILMQGNLTEAQLTARMATFSSDIEKDGTWDNDSAKQSIARGVWTPLNTLSNDTVNWKQIRSDIDTATDARNASTSRQVLRAVENFWWLAHGSGECNEKNNGKIKRIDVPDDDGFTGYQNYQVYCALDHWVDMMPGNFASGWPSLPLHINNYGWYEIPKEVRLNQNINYGTMIDDRDKQTYKTVVIGEQIWMAENLNYDYKVGEDRHFSACGEWGNCWGDYSDEIKKCGAVAGLVYDRAAALDSLNTGCGRGKPCAASGMFRGICPMGWHLPDSAEKAMLVAATGDDLLAATGYDINYYRSYGYDRALDNLLEARRQHTDAYGFSALSIIYETSASPSSRFWTSTQALDTANRSAYPKPVRCVKD